MAFVAIGAVAENALAQRMKNDFNAVIFYPDTTLKTKEDIAGFVNKLNKEFKKIVVGVHNLTRTPATNFGLNELQVDLVNELNKPNTLIFQFGNAYAAKNWCDAKNLVICYEDDDIIQQVAADLLEGKRSFKGVLPVTVCEELKFGNGIVAAGKPSPANQWGMDLARLNKIDSIAYDAIDKKAAPGCVVLVLKDGKIAFQKAYGNTNYITKEPVTVESVFDMASVTKICATTISVMKLYDEGKIDLKKTLGDYLPFVRGTNKEHLPISKILLHQAGLVSYIPFYKETIDSAGRPLPGIYSDKKKDSFTVRVADHFYMSGNWLDTILQRIIKSPLGPADKYVYSDNDFIFLGKIVEQVTGMSLDAYAKASFYTPMSLASIGFKPLQKHPIGRIVPTEDENKFRQQLIRGDVHDPGAAMLGGVAGHAGLFSNAYDIAAIMQMLMNGGTYNGRRYLQKETVELFTRYQSNISRRGYGFDKPEKDNESRKEPYPTLSASPKTFGHTGFTGTCTWADPEKNLVYVFLSNRVNPSGSDVLLKMNVRPKIHETIYQAIIN
jgi:CubicO group peptidase (beta-lactamase class C family)